MTLGSFEAIVRALNQFKVGYLVAGGLAVNAHGYLRMTRDVDLVIALNPENIVQTFDALATLKYQPLVPITARDFSNPVLRQQWIEEKGMKVLNFFSDQYKDTPIDVFVFEPFDYQEELKVCMRTELLPGIPVQFVSLAALIRMKEIANRPRDQDDLQHLRWIQEDQDHEQ